jgi:SAM-dependent methyltransferase
MLHEIDSAHRKTLEISGGSSTFEKQVQFGQYETTEYPTFDICADTLDRTFGLIIANQVFEHLAWPYRAGKNVYQMLEPGGYFLITVPFLIRIHKEPIDCNRWTETGLTYLLEECGFPRDAIRTDSWGNRACVRANFGSRWAKMGWYRNLRNEPDYPVVVWALARKA